MAKKKTAQETCMFCGEFPCKCNVISRSKLEREQHAGGDDVRTQADLVASPEGGGSDPDPGPTEGEEERPDA